MRLKLVMFGTVAALALTMPVIASSVGEPSSDLLARGEIIAPSGTSDAGLETHVAALVVRGQSGPPESSNLGGAPSVPVPIDPPVIVPVDLPLAPPKRVAHVVHAVPAVATEQVANTAPAEFHADRLWVIGSFR